MKILGIDFYSGDTTGVVNTLKGFGGLLVVPAAPALVNIESDPEYYRSLQTADIVIPDSGYMCLIWNLTRKQKIKRISGLEFLQTFLSDREVISNGNFLLVDPRESESSFNLKYLNDAGYNLDNTCSYIAPMYKKNKIEDEALLKYVIEKRPKYILINLGGGVQEKLGAYLKEHLNYKPAIICTGAAIAFLTGQQASIPLWGDQFYLGWLFRCIDKPKIYIPRYLKAFRLFTMMLPNNSKHAVN